MQTPVHRHLCVSAGEDVDLQNQEPTLPCLLPPMSPASSAVALILAQWNLQSGNLPWTCPVPSVVTFVLALFSNISLHCDSPVVLTFGTYIFMHFNNDLLCLIYTKSGMAFYIG
jgi:hypothetical protein